MALRNKQVFSGLAVSLVLAVIVLLGMGVMFFEKKPEGPPDFIIKIFPKREYDGVSDDLLTGGLGLEMLKQSAPPPFTNALNPKAAELRRWAIFYSYLGLVDRKPAGGFGRLFGPSGDNDGKIPGQEFLALADDGSGKKTVTLMVQVPEHFNPAEPCIVAAPSSGSRGVYGAVATAGEWGLEKGCAVAYTDKGTGIGAHDLQHNLVVSIDGKWQQSDALQHVTFKADLTKEELKTFNDHTRHRFAFKHAHSQQHPEADWGLNVLQSIEFAFYILNAEYSWDKPITPDQTIVIASSISNGGGASIRAAEQDRNGLIDGVAVAEPNVTPMLGSEFKIVQGKRPALSTHSRSLFDYATLINVYQGCANSNPGLNAPQNKFGHGGDEAAKGEARCWSLAAKRLLKEKSLPALAARAQEILNDHGLAEEQNRVQPSHWTFSIPLALAVTYANAYAAVSVRDNLCGFSFAATDEHSEPAELNKAIRASMFAIGNGIPPTLFMKLINNRGLTGQQENSVSRSPSTGAQDQNLDGALCLRALAIGRSPVTGKPLTGPMKAVSDRILRNIDSIRANGNLRGKPAIYVTGRNDAVLAINHTSRAYYGLNHKVEGRKSQLRYYEVLNAHHLDFLNGFFKEFSEQFVPLHVYFNQAMDLMYAHLKSGDPLPPSQVVRTHARGNGAPPLSRAHVPLIVQDPPAADRINFANDRVEVPE